jgi:hypothetical protein
MDGRPNLPATPAESPGISHKSRAPGVLRILGDVAAAGSFVKTSALSEIGGKEFSFFTRSSAHPALPRK